MKILITAEIGANADATGADGAALEVTDAKLYVPVLLYQQKSMEN